jgi:tRNA G18 (ribose-2'-O)-methylase SpoU
MSELLAGESAPVYVVGRQLMADTVGFDLHRGVVAIGRRLPEPAPLAAVGASSVLLVLEGVNDHENLGALFRNARALGAGAVLMDPTTADPLYRRSIRVSLGHVLRVPFARLDPWPAGLSDLRVAGYTVVALTPDRRAAPIDEPSTWPHEWRRCAVRADRSHTTRGGGLGPVALLVGAEGGGLTAGARAVADVELRIPMVAGVDSLNVATAAAIALHRLAPSPPA